MTVHSLLEVQPLGRPWLLLPLAFLFWSCGDKGENPCADVSCSDHGVCFTMTGSEPLCACFQGFVPHGSECVENTGCAGVSCDGHGQCVEDGGAAVRCECSAGYLTSPDGFHCFSGSVPDGDADVDGDADSDQDDDDADHLIECSNDSHCTDPGEARCDLDSHLCTYCDDDSQCEAGVEGLPFCLLTTGTCVACLEASHCAEELGTRVCDVSDHVCRDCFGSLECAAETPELPVCVDDGRCMPCSEADSGICGDDKPRCYLNECVACLTYEDCPDGNGFQLCELENHQCTSCGFDTDCTGVPNRPRCDGAGRCVECLGNSDCISAEGAPLLGRVCDYATSACHSACRVCETRDDCTDAMGEGFLCAVDWDGVSHCLQVPRELGDACDPPWAAKEFAAPGERDPIRVCGPPEPTSCFGVAEFGTACDSTDLCGEDNPMLGNDGTCEADTAGVRRCTYACRDDIGDPQDTWCPSGSSCGPVSDYCELL